MSIVLVSGAAPTLAASASSVRAATPRGIARVTATVRRDRQVLRFFARHRWLLRDPRFAAEAHRQVRAHRRHLARALRAIAAERRVLRRLRSRHRVAIHHETAASAICRVFGPAYCRDALRVARCESRLHTNARNGQYLGLFQMGSLARQLYGHGPSAEKQARAARRYFIASGRDWSPWSCRPR